MNSRMANAIADDENPETRGAWSYADGPWDAERSTREFIAALPAYRAHGLLAVCLNLSGGSPQGYSWNQPWKICGFNADGTIKTIAERTVPHSLATVSSNVPVRATLELAAGVTEKLNIRVGDKVRHKLFGTAP